MRSPVAPRGPWPGVLIGAAVVALVAAMPASPHLSPPAPHSLTRGVQGTPDRPDRPDIVGTIHVEAGPAPLGGYYETITGTIRWRYRETDGAGGDHYDIASGTIDWETSEGHLGVCTMQGGPTRGHYADGELGPGLAILPDGRYYGSAPPPAAMLTTAVVLLRCPDGPESPIGGMVSAVFYVPITAGARVVDGRLAGTADYDHATFSWDFAYEGRQPELVVEVESYADWLPRAGADEATPGNAVTIVARARDTDGTPITAGRYRFELVETSREPGIAMNYPHAGATTPDLQLTAGLDVTARDDVDGQWLETGAGTQGVAEISAFDYGAFGTLRVTATLPGGREVVGTLDGHPGRTQILLPKRADGSLVADAWKSSVGGGGDADDHDAEPEGDGHAGDGLTLYEEYRGFVENGRHVRTDPRRKDLFVLNSIGAAATEGVLLFASITGLDVHHQFTPEEISASRVVNPNHAAGPHAVDQHALWLRRLRPAFGEAGGGPGTPATVSYIDLADFGTPPPGQPDLNRAGRLAHTAHEMLHGANVWHHGEADDMGVRWVVRTDADGQPERAPDGSFVFRDPGGRVLDVRREDGGPYVPTLVQLPDIGRPGLVVSVGYLHGEHSGDEACVMRYKSAEFSADTRATTLRYWNGGPQAVGLRLCQRPDGTGANAPGRSPRPRYGSAASGAATGPGQRGACVHQICVNDAHAH